MRAAGSGHGFDSELHRIVCLCVYRGAWEC